MQIEEIILQSFIIYNLISYFILQRIEIFNMGNSVQNNDAEESAAEMVHRKAEVEFKQGDFIKQIEGSIQNEYSLLSPCLQQNQFYEVRKAIHLKTTLTRVVYIVNKYKIRSHQRQLFEQQINKLKKIDHPAIPKIYELFKNDHRFFVVLEYKQGQTLATILQRQTYFQQSAAASIIWQLLSLLHNCHNKGIVHTDLKLTSVSFNSKRQETIKIEDFCISKIFRIEEIVEQSLGRAVLTAPETISGQTSSKSDIWSCGVILYIILCGQPPIIAQTKPKLIQKFKLLNLRFKQKRFKFVSEAAKQLIRKMMRINPNERPSADEIMESPWFIKYHKIPRLPANSLRRCLRQLFFFNPKSKLQLATWAFFVNALISFDQKELIMSIFLKLDIGSKGYLTEEDIYDGFLQLLQNEDAARKCSKKIMKRLQVSKMYFSQFVTYCANRFFLVRESNLQKIFRIFDDDGSGEIEISELRDTLGNSKQVSEQVWLQLMKEADSDSDGKISYQQFSQLIRNLNYADQQSQFDLDNPFSYN